MRRIGDDEEEISAVEERRLFQGGHAYPQKKRQKVSRIFRYISICKDWFRTTSKIKVILLMGVLLREMDIYIYM